MFFKRSKPLLLKTTTTTTTTTKVMFHKEHATLLSAICISLTLAIFYERSISERLIVWNLVIPSCVLILSNIVQFRCFPKAEKRLNSVVHCLRMGFQIRERVRHDICYYVAPFHIDHLERSTHLIMLISVTTMKIQRLVHINQKNK